MPESSGRERDLILAPNQYSFILDETKGVLSVYVGPNKTSLAATDRPVAYNAKTRQFEKTSLDGAVRECPFADEGWYIVLENPAASPESAHPATGSSTLTKLESGRKVNIPGPATFPLWPGQNARVIAGHHLRSNQYLVVRVYNEEAAKANWDKSVMKPAGVVPPDPSNPKGSEDQKEKDPQSPRSDSPGPSPAATVPTPDLTMGKLLIIKGTDVSFYIPPTGIEVVPDAHDQYVRDAVTLERLEYCILLNEDGTKRFVEGPEVVFPSPTETFVEKNGSRKFKAIELNDDMGIYVKVIADYGEGSEAHKAGEELFITGKDQKIYYPRQEHAIIKYGDREVHYGVAIPDGEARYVLNKNTGSVELVRGPKIFLPDPRTQVIVRRVLDDETVRLWFPGNDEALAYNRQLRSLTPKPGDYVTDQAFRKSAGRSETLGSGAKGLAGDDFQRGQDYTPPRTITLDTKYDGAVSINVWTGYAILVVNKKGDQRVVVGPQTALLEYDETLQILTLSTGKPKTTDKVERTAYLRVKHNQVSDIVQIVTKDMVEVDIRLSYRVDFEGEPTKWFSVENYVKFLCDHTRSLLRNAGKQHGIEDFNNDAITYIRDTILGAQDGGKRTGRAFEENGMRIYDVEILGVAIGDSRISALLAEAQHETVHSALMVARRERELAATQRTEEIEQKIAVAQAKTKQTKRDLEIEEIGQQLILALAKVKAEVDAASAKLAAKLDEQDKLNAINAAELQREKARSDQDLADEAQQLEQDLKRIEAEVRAAADKAKAFTPDLIAALQAFSDRALAEKMAESMSPLAILGGKSVADVFTKLLQGTVVEGVIKRALAAAGSDKEHSDE